MLSQVWLIRHGETSWSKSGQHTGRTDLPLTADGARQVLWLRASLSRQAFTRVCTSPAARARQTCDLAGLSQSAEIDPDLAEWDYGAYEGRRTVDIVVERPDWNLFLHGCPDGESPDQVSLRCDRLIARWRGMSGTIAVFSHGHFGRALAARWIGLAVVEGRRFRLDTASLSVFGCDHGRADEPVIERWNVVDGPPAANGSSPA